MNHWTEMLLKWARSGTLMEMIAHGWMLRDSHCGDEEMKLDAIDRMYVKNVITARRNGVSA